MEIVYSKSAVKSIKLLDGKMKQRIKDEIEGLLKNLPLGDIKQLQGINPINYRLRIGKYRVIYEYIGNNQNVLYIKDIGSRGYIYREMILWNK